MKKALILGISGQDGSYLAELLLKKNYMVWGFVRSFDKNRLKNIYHIKDKINLIQGDLLNTGSVINAICQSEPDEIYNLGGYSEISSSWEDPILVTQSIAVATINI